MIWTLSRYRAGELVEVRSCDEILATLDEHGRCQGLPFMPEMFQFCGQRFRVRAVAHKTCETARETWQGRRMQTTVHLADLRCDGSAHGGCEAACSLFWKDAWLKPVGEVCRNGSSHGWPPAAAAVCSLGRLQANTRSCDSVESEDSTFVCQVTKLYDATDPLAWWDLRQYVLDVMTGNHTVGRVLRVTWLATLRKLVRSVDGVRFVRGACWRFSEWMHRRLTGRGAHDLFKKVKPCDKTPTGRLDLKPGELVRIKSKGEIEATLDERGRIAACRSTRRDGALLWRHVSRSLLGHQNP